MDSISTEPQKLTKIKNQKLWKKKNILYDFHEKHMDDTQSKKIKCRHLNFAFVKQLIKSKLISIENVIHVIE